MKRWAVGFTLLALSVGCDRARNVGVPSPPPPVVPAAETPPLPTVENMPSEVKFPEVPSLASGGTSGPGESLSAARYAQRTKEMLEAAEKGRISLLLEHVKQGAVINDKDDQGQTALHKAAAAGHKSAVVTVLALGGELNERDSQGRTALMAAAAEGNVEIVLLLKSPDAVNKLAQDALGSAAQSLNLGLGSLASRLTTAGFSQAELTDKQGRTALMLAGVGGHENCVAPLLSWNTNDRKAELSKADRKGQNVLMLSAAAGHANIVDLLLHQTSEGPGLEYLKATDHAGKTALDLAQDAGHEPIVKLLELERALYAAAAGDVEGVEAARAKYPEQLTPPALMRRAVAGGGLTVIEHLKQPYREKSSQEKLRLMGAVPGSNLASGVLSLALTSSNAAVLKAVLDRKWWNDEDARKSLIDFAEVGHQQVLKSDWYRKERAEAIALIEAARKECEEKPE